jgi:hypothetical protein
MLQCSECKKLKYFESDTLTASISSTIGEKILDKKYGIAEIHTISLLENLKRRDHSEAFGVDGRIILEWILDK